MSDKQNALTGLVTYLLIEEPFYGHFLAGIPRKFSDETDALAWAFSENKTFELLVRPNFEVFFGVKKARYLLKHEVLHFLFRHPVLRRRFAQKNIYDLAADFAVNQFLDTQLIDNEGIIWDCLPGEMPESRQSVSWYYDRLNEMAAPGSPYSEQVESLLKRHEKALARHRFWEPQAGAFPSAEMALAESFVCEQIRKATQRAGMIGYGTLPADLENAINQNLAPAPAQTDWRRILRLFAATARKTTLQNTLRRPSRRYRTVPGLKIRKQWQILVGVDVSGSINEEEWRRFWREIYHIWRQGAAVTVVECDARIQRLFAFNGQLPETRRGRGGTSFNPVFEYAAQTRPDALIYFTDGRAPAPFISPGFPVFWVISGQGIDPGSASARALPGRVVKMHGL